MRAEYRIVGSQESGRVFAVADIEFGRRNSSPIGFAPYKHELFFDAYSNTAGRDLWKVQADGSVVQAAESIRVPAICDHRISPSSPGSSISRPLPTGYGRELWKVQSDGSVAVANESGTPSGFTEFMGELYFADSFAGGHGIWKVDQERTLVQVTEFRPAPPTTRVNHHRLNSPNSMANSTFRMMMALAVVNCGRLRLMAVSRR